MYMCTTSQVLQSGCFSLCKWTFNSDVDYTAHDNLFVCEHTQNKTFGVGWYNDSDELYYTTKMDEYSNVSNLTKRVLNYFKIIIAEVVA